MTLLEDLSPFLSLKGDALEERRNDAEAMFARFLTALEMGEVRAARSIDGTWTVEPRVKEGILLGFRLGELVEMGDDGLPFIDKSTYPLRRFELQHRVRIVPGGSSVRRGAYLGPGVTMMPPAYVNVGAFVDEGTMVDSHALVGSCAQVGKRVHLSAAAQIGGVLEPIGAVPVVIEDDVLVGGNVGVYEGAIVRSGAVLGAGVVLTASTRVYDLVHETVISAAPGAPLEIPANAVVVPGSRPARGAFAEREGLSLATPIIVKYRDARTDARAALEDALRAK